MTAELDKQLCDKYPLIFRDRNASKMVTAMCWGFPGDGWYWIIDHLCHMLQWHTDHNDGPQIIATQVKEKFGTLSFYVQEADEHGRACIAFAEHLSRHICEKCGSTTDVKQVGAGASKTWIKTLCPKCNV